MKKCKKHLWSNITREIGRQELFRYCSICLKKKFIHLIPEICPRCHTIHYKEKTK